MIASDGNAAGEIDLTLSGSEHLYGFVVPAMALMRALERRAGRYPRERRLELLLQDAEVILRSDEFREADFDFNPHPTANQ